MTVRQPEATESAGLRRRLALFFCDLAGTWRLLAEDGDLATASVLRAFFEHAERLGKAHHCEVIKFSGDGFLAALKEITEALPLARAIQALLTEVPALAGRSLGFRFSLHSADVLCLDTTYGKDVFGDDVAVVAYLNDLARRGQIVITQAAFERLPVDQQVLATRHEIVQVKGEDVPIHRLRLVPPQESEA